MIPERVTTHPDSNEQLLYFTCSSLTSDDRHLFFISDRTGDYNVFVRDLESGEERQVTDNDEGYLHSYMYFDGQEYRGFGRASTSIHEDSGTLYYLQGREIHKVSLDGKAEVINELPEGLKTGFTHVSADGSRFCVPTVEARAIEEPLGEKPSDVIDPRVQKENLNSYLKVFDTKSGELLVDERVNKGWITHVQFSPVDPTMILYNHEWPADCGIRRMWLYDGKEHRQLRDDQDGRSRKDWACHEMWEKDGKAIIYHGGYSMGLKFIGRLTLDDGKISEISLPDNYEKYGHFTVGDPGVLVSDGYHEVEGDRGLWGGDWLSKVEADWDNQTSTWHPICRHDSSWTSQDSHPHPIFDHACKYIYFTSDFEGKRAVYRVKVD